MLMCTFAIVAVRVILILHTAAFYDFVMRQGEREMKQKKKEKMEQRQLMTADKHLLNKSHANIFANYDLFHFTSSLSRVRA